MSYIHASKTKINKINNIKQKSNYKPSGLWYAHKNNWLEWAKKFDLNRYRYLYKLKLKHTKMNTVDKENILLIQNKTDFFNFTVKYGEKKETAISNIILIKWNKVAKDFGGIELKNIKRIIEPNEELKKKFKLNPDKLSILWNYLFDIDSGCVWNVNAIIDFKQT